jgi:hypothetical protein
VATPGTAPDDSSTSARRLRGRGAAIAVRIRDSGPTGWLLLTLATLSALALFLTELSTLSYRTIGIGGCESRVDPGVCTTSAGDAHNHAFWIIAVFVLVFAVGAALGRSRPAAVALIALGALVLVWSLSRDAPKLGSLRGLDAIYTNVRAHTGAGFYLELLGGVFAVAAGVVGFVLPRAPAPAETVEERVAARAARRRGRG